MVSQSAKSHIENLRPFALAIEGSNKWSPCYAASKDHAAAYEFRGAKLVARGTIVDKVDGLAGSRKTDLIQSTADCNMGKPAPKHMSTSEILVAICKCLVLDRKDQFLRFAMPVDEFLQDFMWLCGQLVTKSTLPVPEEFHEWYDKSKFLKIQGSSLHDVFRDSSERVGFQSTSQTANTDEYIFDSLFGRFYDTVVRMSLRLMVTADGRVGMVPEKARKGDLVVVLLGCNVPVLLRPSSTVEESTYTLVGECFLDDFMYGAGIGEEDTPLKKFCIE